MILQDTDEINGVEQVVQLDRLIPPAGQFFGMLGGVAVIANNTWAAFQGKNNLNIEWESGENKIYNSEKFKEKLISRIHKKSKSRFLHLRGI